jgi:peptidoglycan/LPS O-acetylase OafA/YrhL
MGQSAESNRIPELDGLRGMAIGIVLFFHYFFLITQARPGSLLAYSLSPGRLGWSGVDLFFVLSGFLIGGILLDAREASNFYRVFYTRRFFRIVPPYLFLLLGYLVLGTFVPLHPNMSLVIDNKLPITPYFLFLNNFWMGAHNTLGGTTLGIAWSLAIEEQFYLTLPLLIRFVPTRRLAPVLLTGIGMAEVLRLSLLFWLPKNWTFYMVLMPCRADALLLGVLGAYALREPTRRKYLQDHRRYLWVPLVVLAAGIAIMVRLLPKIGYILMAAGGYTVIAAFFLTFLMYGLLIPESWLSRCLRWKWLGALGMIAYGTYLFHELALNAFFAVFRSAAPRIVSFGDLVSTLAALGSTIAFCSLSWRFFEKPLVRIGHRQNYLFEPPEDRLLIPSAAKGAEIAEVC